MFRIEEALKAIPFHVLDMTLISNTMTQQSTEMVIRQTANPLEIVFGSKDYTNVVVVPKKNGMSRNSRVFLNPQPEYPIEESHVRIPRVFLNPKSSTRISDRGVTRSNPGVFLNPQPEYPIERSHMFESPEYS